MTDNNQIKVKASASKPSLNDKIMYKVDPTKDTVFWYIKFNILLDESTINEKSMFVSDLAGYKMRTFIEYSEEYNVISISPIDTYSPNTYYILNMTTKVKSKKGNPLRSQINIVFKIVNGQMSNYEVLKDDTKLPPVKDRPKNYDPENVVSKVYGFDADFVNKKGKDNLPYLPFKINPAIGIIGLMICILAILSNQLSFAIIGAFIAFLGVIHIIIQIANKEKRAVYIYNNGVRYFRNGKYKKAKDSFKHAFQLDPYNEVIEFALSRIEYYL